MPTPMMLPTINAIAVVRPNRAGGLAAVPAGAAGVWVVVDIVHLTFDSCSGLRRFGFICGAALPGQRSVRLPHPGAPRANALRSRGVWVCVAAGQRRSSHVGSVGPGGRRGLTLRE